MRYRMIVCALAIVTMGTCSQSLLAGTSYNVACEGTVCGGGGGGREYEYSVKNTSGVDALLRLFYIGTDAPTLGDYTNWLDPEGFTHQVVLSGSFSFMGTALSMTNTDHKKFAHTAPHNETGSSTTYEVVWTNATGTTLTDGQALTFGFDNPNTYQNTEWVAMTLPGVGTAADASENIVGPVGFYGRGYAHAPAPEPATLSLLALGGLALLHRRRSA